MIDSTGQLNFKLGNLISDNVFDIYVYKHTYFSNTRSFL